MIKKINIKTNSGVKEMDLLYHINIEKTKRNFIIYTDNAYDQNNNLIAFVAAYKLDETSKYSILEQNISEYEYSVINKVIKDGYL